MRNLFTVKARTMYGNRMPRNIKQKLWGTTKSRTIEEPEHMVVHRRTLTEGEMISSIPYVYAAQFASLTRAETKINSVPVDPAIRELKAEIERTRTSMLRIAANNDVSVLKADIERTWSNTTVQPTNNEIAQTNDDDIVDISVLKAEIERTRSKMMSVGSSARVAISLNAWQHRARAEHRARAANLMNTVNERRSSKSLD